jgi:hypothetical protein
MWHCRVSRAPLDGDGEKCARRHNRSVVHGYCTRLETWPIMKAKDPVDRKSVKQSISEHRLRSAKALLRRLEDEAYCPLPSLVGGKQRGCAQKGRYVAIMPACMHDSWITGGIRQARLLDNWKRVEVRSKADATPAKAAR